MENVRREEVQSERVNSEGVKELKSEGVKK